ncbi:MAG: hypothetical protein ACR2NA_00865 [Solirubrobacterales bacterium]
MTTTVQTVEKQGLRPITEFIEAHSVWPRGGRPAALRDAATAFRSRFATPDNQVRSVRSVDLASAAYPARFAFGGAATALNPYINIVNRLVVVQFEDFDGQLRTLVWEPTVAEGPAEAPFYQQQIERYGEFLSYKVLATIWTDVPGALASVGLTCEDVDYFSFDHLHVQDPRLILGTTQPIDGESVPRPPLFPNAKALLQREEVATFEDLHPMQWAWYVADGMQDVITDSIVLLDGDVELGKGVALAWTPGHTDGNQSLVINTPEGVWVSSENGVCADNWQPHLSAIRGLRRNAEFFGREVILNSNTLEDSLDQYDSMIKEKALADPSRRDPRWLNILPSSEMPAWKRQWPIAPTHFHGGLAYGVVESPAGGSNGRPA